MAEERVAAHVAHASRGRLRLRIPERRGDTAYFARLAADLRRCEGIVGAEGTARSGSLLLRHLPGLGLADIAAQAERLGLSLLSHPPVPSGPTLVQHAGAGIDALDRTLVAASGGRVDLSSAVLLGLLATAARQAARGQILPPTASLLWYALVLVNQSKPAAK